MKAEFKKTRTPDGLPLTVGKMYDVLDMKTEKRQWQIKEIKIKNDLGQECWYPAYKFNLLDDATAYPNKPTAGVSVGQKAARSTAVDGSQIYVGIDMAGDADMTAMGVSLEHEEERRRIAAELVRAFGFNYGA